MAGIYVLHKVIAGTAPDTVTYYFNTSDVYDTIKTETGIEQVSDPSGGEVIVPVKELIRAGKIVRLVVKVENGSNSFYAKLLVSRLKLATLFTANGSTLDGKDYSLNNVSRGTIETVHFIRKRRFFI